MAKGFFSSNMERSEGEAMIAIPPKFLERLLVSSLMEINRQENLWTPTRVRSFAI